MFILVCSGVWLTESIDDLAAEEINELEGVLVLNRQAHEELGAGRSAEPLLDVFACFQVGVWGATEQRKQLSVVTDGSEGVL